MKRLSRILVAIDLFAPPSMRSSEFLSDLTASADSELHILHAIERDTPDNLRKILGGKTYAEKAP